MTQELFNNPGPDPVILITDLLPAEAIEGPMDRAYPFVLADYLVYLKQGVRELALLRKLNSAKGIKNVEERETKEDPDYATDDGGSAGSMGSSKDSAGSGEGLE